MLPVYEIIRILAKTSSLNYLTNIECFKFKVKYFFLVNISFKIPKHKPVELILCLLDRASS